MVDGYELDAWTVAVEDVLGDAESWIRAGSAKAAGYSWETTARETWALYRQVAG